MIDSRAYTEAYEVIKKMPIEWQNKIPKNLKNAIELNRDKNYKINIEDFENTKFLKDTEKILSVIYTDYLSTPEEKKIILAKENSLKKSC